MKRPLIIIVALLLLPLVASSKGVTYFKGTIYEALDAASRSDKLLLVEFYAPWSYKSRWARDNMMNDTELLRNFVVYSVETTSAQGASLAATYEVFDYPNILIFNKNGAVLDRISRTMDSADFTAHLSQTLLATDGHSTIQLRRIYMAATEGDTKELNILVDSYLDSFKGRELDITAVMDLFTSSAINYYGSSAFKYMIDNQSRFDSVFVNQRVSSLLTEALIPYISGVNEFDPMVVDHIILTSKNFECHSLITKLAKLSEFRAQNDQIGFIQLLDNMTDQIPTQHQYPLIMSLDFIDASRLDGSIKKITLRIVEKFASTNTSEAKNVVIESLRVKFL